MTESPEIFLRRALRLDLEIEPSSRRIERVGAVRGEGPHRTTFSRRSTSRNSTSRNSTMSVAVPAAVMAELDRFTGDADFVLGHNLLHHDLPGLRAEWPSLRLLGLPVIDTLYLSALAFPRRPYHRLVKDYRLVRESINDPVADAELAGQVFVESWRALADQEAAAPGLVSFYGDCLAADSTGDRQGLATVLRAIGTAVNDHTVPAADLDSLVGDAACCFVLDQLDELRQQGLPPAMAYVVAWLRVAGEDSVLPPWVRMRFPEIPGLLDRLRRTGAAGDPCPKGPLCVHCQSGFSAEEELERYFGFTSFRDEPRAADGESLQRQITRLGLARRSLLAVLATGAGKSLCYQLPALVHFRRRGRLTIVISPLQALMKDQVDNLNQKIGVERAAALNGLLTPPERGRVLERVRLGEIALLYVAPEQLRNMSFRKIVALREIATWVYDEAHCLSKWGHDFRPDYLFAARFIGRLAQEQGGDPPAIACFTATAKKDVAAEIVEHFREVLNLDLEVATSRVERQELRFFVETISAARKLPRIGELLRERFAEGSDHGEHGSAVIYFSSRKATEEAALFLQQQDLDARAFHAGLSPPDKRDVLDAFTSGALRFVCATNAFGMGIDKEDVRLVVHADVPGSLEAYLQEAGRAGRDRRVSDCVLLFDEADIERQFKLSAASKLDKGDIEQLLRAVRRAVRKQSAEKSGKTAGKAGNTVARETNGVVALTIGELLRDEELEIDIRPDDWQADTQVRTALAWLERAGFIERDHNRTWVFQGKIQIRDMEEARRRVRAMHIPAADKRRWLTIIKALMQTRNDRGLTVDELAQSFGYGEPGLEPAQDAGRQVIRDLQAMSKAGLIREGLQLTAYLRPKGKGSSISILEAVSRLERAMIEALQEEDPDAEQGTRVTLSLRRLNQRLLDRGEHSNPETLRGLLKSLSEDGKGLAGSYGSLELRYLRRGHYSARLRRGWDSLSELADRRRQVARVALETLLTKAPDGAGGRLLVAFSLDDVVSAVERDLVLNPLIRDPLAAAERTLLFLHEHRAVQLQNGLAVFRQAMTLKLQPDKKGRRYTHGDYQPLAEHYDERTFQVHAMAGYAREALIRLRRGLELVHDYFEHGREVFVAKWLHEQRDDLHRATGAESYRRIVEQLGDPEQEAVVTAPLDQNLLVLAGPGSGKTRVVVHRCAYLLRVERVPARSILVVCFNRAASLELRRRLRALVGDDAIGVTVCTYHALALRLTGRSLGDGFDSDALSTLIPEAVALLESNDETSDVPGFTSDELRDRLLAGFRHVLVDEYQDIDEPQYRLVSAITGRARRQEEKLSILAVGDDDQTIYGFTGANVRFIRQFQADYGPPEAKSGNDPGESRAQAVHYLVRCYRSSRHIIAAANLLISHNRDRMKTEHPIRADDRRRFGPPGEPVRVLKVRSVEQQAAVVVEQLRRLGFGSKDTLAADTDVDAGAGSVAVLARRHAILEPVYALLSQAFPERAPIWVGHHPLPPLPRVREIRELLDFLREHRHRELSASEVFGASDEEISNPWRALISEILAEWMEETHDQPCPGTAILEYVYESLAEQRRRPPSGRGPVLATIHAAKGLEFDHVFVADGGWLRPGSETAAEEERRLYYVGMTRAKDQLSLMTGIDGPNPHVDLLRGAHDFLEFHAPEPDVPERAVWGRRRELAGLEDVFLSWAGRRPGATHDAIAAVATGDPVTVQTTDDGRLVWADPQGHAIAMLSKRGVERWRPLIDQIEEARIYAWVERRAKDSEPEHRAGLRVERWQVPIVEVILRPV